MSEGIESAPLDELATLFDPELAPAAVVATAVQPSQQPRRTNQPTSAPTQERGTRPAVLDLSGRSLNARKVVTDEGAVPLRARALLPGESLSRLIEAGEISEADALELLKALHQNHTVFASDDMVSLKSILDAAQADLAATGHHPLMNWPKTLAALPDMLFTTLSATNSHIVVSSAGSPDPVCNLHRMLMLGGTQLNLQDLREMITPGLTLRIHRSKPRLRTTSGAQLSE